MPSVVPRRSRVGWPMALTTIAVSMLCLIGVGLTIQSCQTNSSRTRQAAGDVRRCDCTVRARFAQRAAYRTDSRRSAEFQALGGLVAAPDARHTHGVSRVQMTPEGTHLLAFYNTTSSEGSVAKIAAQNGELCWQKQIPLKGRVLETGYINRARRRVSDFRPSKATRSGSSIPTVRYEKGYFEAGPGCEYIGAVITDRRTTCISRVAREVGPGKGSICAKLTSDLQLIWERTYRTRQRQGRLLACYGRGPTRKCLSRRL